MVNPLRSSDGTSVGGWGTRLGLAEVFAAQGVVAPAEERRKVLVRMQLGFQAPDFKPGLLQCAFAASFSRRTQLDRR